MAATPVLTINCGSATIKWRVTDMDNRKVIAAGKTERIGEEEHADHRQALQQIVEHLRRVAPGDLYAIGHRVVHGGELFKEPTVITGEVVERIRSLEALAPLHIPANLLGIELTRELFPNVPSVAVFDTAFHQTMPPRAFRYALPDELYERYHIRRYGFHGTSHAYVAKQTARLLAKPLSSLNLITLHLGNGASAAAIQNGLCIDTSMGMTPLAGLMMGTRCGDIDPALPAYLARVADMDLQAVDDILNAESGLKGICGESDMRRVHELIHEGNDKARLALEMFCYRMCKYIGAYRAVLGRIDALVFTGGIGEHDATVRELTCCHLGHMGINVDQARNRALVEGAGEIQAAGAPIKLLVIPTDEELEIAEQTLECLASR